MIRQGEHGPRGSLADQAQTLDMPSPSVVGSADTKHLTPSAKEPIYSKHVI